MPASKREAVQLALTPESKGKGILFPTGRSQWSSTSQHSFCSPVTVLPLSIWRENRMTNRACSRDVSKIVNVMALKPILGEEAEDSAVTFWSEGPDWWELHPWLLVWGLQRRGTTGIDKRTTYFWVVKYILSKALVLSHLNASLNSDVTMKEISKRHLFVGYFTASGN